MWRLSAAVALALLTARCSALRTGRLRRPDARRPTDITSAASPSERAPPTPGPAGAELTAQGTELALGDQATVAWAPRADVVGAIDVRVTELERAPIRALSAFGPGPFATRVVPLLRARQGPERRRGRPGRRRHPALRPRRPRPADRGHPVRGELRALPELVRCPHLSLRGSGCRSACSTWSLSAAASRAVSFRPTQEFDPITWTGTSMQPKPPRHVVRRSASDVTRPPDFGDHAGRSDNGPCPPTATLPQGLTLGSVHVDTPVVLAPMAGITNAAYRRLCAEQGAGLYVCEMITSRGLVEGDADDAAMLVFDELESVRSVQLYGTDPVYVGQAAEILCAELRRRAHRPQLRLPGPQGHPQGRRGSAAVEARAARRDPHAPRSRPRRRTTCP